MSLTSEQSTIGFTGYATLQEFLFVADTGNHRIQKFDLNGNLIAEWGGFGTTTGHFDSPWGVTSDGSFVYVTDTGNNRVQVFDLDGIFQYTFGDEGTSGGLFDEPRGTVTKDGWLYVVDTANNRVQVFTTSGRFAMAFGTQGDKDGQFEAPIGIAISGSWLYIDDRGNSRIVIIQLNYVDPNYTEPPLEYPRNIKTTYAFRLAGDGQRGSQIPHIPMKRFTLRMEAGSVTMNIIVPFTTEIEQQISARPGAQMWLYQDYHKDDGTIERDFIVSATLENVAEYKGPRNASITLTGRQKTNFRYHARVKIEATLYEATQKGKTRYRIEPIPYIKPKNLVIIKGQTKEVAKVTLSVNKDSAVMEFTVR